MAEPTAAGASALRELQAALDAAAPYALVPVLVRALAAAVSAKEVSLLLADYGESTLARLTEDSPDDVVEELPIAGTAAGVAYQRQGPAVADGPHGAVAHLPVTVRSERIGVLEVHLPEHPDAPTSAVLADVATTLAYVITAARRYSDLFERLRRRRALALAAEVQWELLPVLGYAGEAFSLAGALEPAYDIAGDSFDYAVDPHRVLLGVVDAMGHGLEAALLCALAVASLRNSRRAGQPLDGQAASTSEVLFEQFGSGRFATALLVGVDLRTGAAEVVNAGHSFLHRVREGRVERVELSPDLPLGIEPGVRYRQQPLDLRPGDRLVLLTDGVFDAGPRGADTFGEDRVRRLLLATRDLEPNQCARAVTRSVLAHAGGRLGDDATVLCFDWHGGRGASTLAGA